MKDPLEVLAFVSSEFVNDKRAFEKAKLIGSSILDLLKKESPGCPKGAVYLAIYLVVCALVDASALLEATEHKEQLN